MCIHIEESFPHAYSLSLSLFFSLVLSLSPSRTLFHVRSLIHFVALSCHPPHTHVTTRYQHGVHTIHMRIVRTIDGARKPTPRVRRGFESQSRHVSRLAHNVRSCNGHIWSPLLAESKSERARIRSAFFAS